MHKILFPEDFKSNHILAVDNMHISGKLSFILSKRQNILELQNLLKTVVNSCLEGNNELEFKYLFIRPDFLHIY